MRTFHVKQTSSKSLVMKWFKIKSKSQLFQEKDDSMSRGDGEWRSSSFSEREPCRVKKSIRGGSTGVDRSLNREKNFDLDPAQASGVLNYRIFVSTWNVGGRSPPSCLNLDDWLLSSPYADIYVLGFQEVVPLNAGNILVTENKAPAKKWVSLIGNTLNSSSSGGSGRSCVDFLDSSSSRRRAGPHFNFSGGNSAGSLSSSFRTDSGLSFSGRSVVGEMTSDGECHCGWNGSDEDEDEGSFRAIVCSPSSSSMDRENECRPDDRSRYTLVAKKQMVGIFLTLWVRTEIKDMVRDLRVSYVGRGLMGYLGNKGSISISMTVHETSFCFVCCHLSSGERERDELRRNSDVVEILRRTRFSPVHFRKERTLPETILDHSRIIWLGDLNYRLTISPYAAKFLAQAGDWSSLLQNDQLHKEQQSSRVFEGWKEAEITFPPTYKYSANSDRFVGEDVSIKEKRRTPAWCDRILSYGEGLSQVSYLRGDSKLSDHRPVYGVFSAEVEVTSGYESASNCTPCSCSPVDVEEFLR